MNKHFKLSHGGTLKLSPKLYFVSTKCQKGQSHWLCGLRCGSTATRLQRLWVWIPQGLWISVCCECCVLSGRGLQQANHPSRRYLPSVQCLRRGLHEATLCATRQQIHSLTSEQAGSKLVMPITCRNEKAGRWASGALIHHSTSRRWTEEF
jgi:hypothetical protein